ncbi:hypothetical protein [Nonomuraea sp. 10N515B]|uniref:hypothetical protein n=1 Tax=Nonomuraea sp. 10N515B TaxID=3457422 RepID=UPI003FCD5DB3
MHREHGVNFSPDAQILGMMVKRWARSEEKHRSEYGCCQREWHKMWIIRVEAGMPETPLWGGMPKTSLSALVREGGSETRSERRDRHGGQTSRIPESEI